MKCSRCGQEAHDYGTDGLSYCGSCLFYGLNKACNKCRMYLPATELQMVRGQLICPNCIMDVRDEEKRREYKPDEGKKERYNSPSILPEQCERCGRELTTVYFYNGKHLCSTCVESEKKEWDTVHGEGPPMVMYRIKGEKVRQKSLIVALNKRINEFVGGILRAIIKEDETERDQKMQKPLVDKIVNKQENLAKFKDAPDLRTEKEIEKKTAPMKPRGSSKKKKSDL